MNPIVPVITPNIKYRELPIHECGEALVSLSNLSPKIKVYPYYHHAKLLGALTDCYLREGVAAKLLEAAEHLPTGCFFVVLDGFRPYEVQLELYHGIKRDILARGDGLNEEELAKEIAKFVAYPSPNVDTPSPHMSGGAVDLTVANEEGWLDMGTEFDDFSDKAQTAWFEGIVNPTELERKIQDNRRLLYHAMLAAGFANYENEWWHYDFGNQRWAMHSGQTAIYKGKELKDCAIR